MAAAEVAIARAHAPLCSGVGICLPDGRANAAQLFNQARLFAHATVEQSQNAAWKRGLERPAPSVPDVAFALMADKAGAHVRPVLLRLTLVPLDDGRAGCVLAHGYLHG